MGEATNLTFFDGEKTHKLTTSGFSPNGDPRYVANVAEERPRSIISPLALKPAFLAFRGLEPQVSEFNLDGLEIVAQDALTVTVRQPDTVISRYELILKRDQGLMPIAVRIFYNGKLYAEGTISYGRADGPPYVPETWSMVNYTPAGITTAVSKVQSFSLTPSIDLASYTFEIPKSTHILPMIELEQSAGSQRGWSVALTICITVLLLILVARKRLLRTKPS
jgi:hypothetical protein